MVEDIENKYVYVSYDKIWSKLKHYFYINDYDINIILLKNVSYVDKNFTK
jgi:hypothetical protein